MDYVTIMKELKEQRISRKKTNGMKTEEKRMIIERKQLMEDLSAFAKDEFKLPPHKNLNEYTAAMLNYIGDPDPTLRDELICSAFYDWIGEKKYYTAIELKTLLQVLVDEKHLFCGIGEKGTDSVFTRTFSVLIVGLVLWSHKEKPFLSKEEFFEAKNKVLKYYMQEQDLRGYLEDEGWAHGAAHGADVLDELVNSLESDAHTIQEVLTGIRIMLHNGKEVFHHEEDERIARVVYRMIRQGKVTPEMLKEWFKGVTDCLSGVGDMKLYRCRVNSKNFIRCLYFRLLHFDVNQEFINCLVEAEKTVNRYIILDKEIN